MPRGSASAPTPPASLQKHWLPGQIVIPILLSMVFVALLSAVVGVVILRRRGVYFSLLTLALAALTYTVAFRWTEVTGGEDGLSGLVRGSIGPFSLDDARVFYVMVAAIGAGRAVRAVARGALAVRARADGDPREPAARHVPGLSGGALQAGGVRPVGGGDRARRRPVGLPDLSRVGGGRLGALLRRTAGHGRDRRHAPHPGTGARRAVLRPVPRAVLDLVVQLAALVRPRVRRLRAVLAGWPGRHLGQAAAAMATGAGRSGGHEQAQDLRGPAVAGVPAAGSRCRERCSTSAACPSNSAASAPSPMRA